MPLGKRQRRFIWALGIIAAFLVVMWLAFPLWFPWVLEPVAPKLGAHYSRYERLGYSRFALYGLSYTNRHVRVVAKRTEGLVPTVWLWTHLTRGTPFVRADGWEYHSISIPDRRPRVHSVFTNAQIVVRVLEPLRAWLPQATLSNGLVDAGTFELELPAVTWSRGKLYGEVHHPQSGHKAKVTAHLGARQPYQAQIDSASLGLQANVLIHLRTNVLAVESEGWWRSNRINMEAEFGRNGQLPATATLQAAHFKFPGSVFRLTHYGEIAGSLRVQWEQSRYTADIEAAAQPRSSDTNLPPVQVIVQVRGDTNAAMIESATIFSPGLQLELSKQLRLHFRGPLVREPASLKLSADLSRQPWSGLQGVLQGEGMMTPTEGRFPKAIFELRGSQIGKDDLRASNVELRVAFNWPELNVEELKANFEDGSSLAANARVNVASNMISEAVVECSGPLPGRWLPEGYAFENLALVARAHGPLKAPIHSGRLTVTNFTSPSFQPFQVQFDWEGEKDSNLTGELSAAAGQALLSTRLDLAMGPAGTNLVLHALVLKQGGTNLLELERPCHINLSALATNRLTAQLDTFSWRGPGGQIEVQADVDWPSHGSWSSSIREVRSELIQPLLKEPLPQVQIHHLDCDAGWNNGPLSFGFHVSMEGATKESISLLAEGDAWGDQSGVTISNLNLSTQGSEIASLHGTLPLRVNPAQPVRLFSMEMEDSLHLLIRTQPHAILWNKLAELTGLVLGEPDFNVNVKGTWAAPEGIISLSARHVEFREIEREIPSFESLRLAISLERERARITEGRFVVQQQPVVFSGEIPLGQEFWEGLKEKKLPNWQRATGELRITEAEVAAFSPLLPTLLSPQGTLDAAVTLQKGGQLSGHLQLQKARTRPIANLGSVRDINAKLNFAGRTISLENASAEIGGSKVTASGEGDLSGTEWLKGAVPPFHFVLQGTNVPLSRQPESILRSDLDLIITKTNGKPALISGAAHLRDSFFLSDLQDLVPKQVTSPARRPPFFSVEIPPLSDWRLNVRVSGNRFMRVRSTLFNGEVSANLRVEGTLKEPIALGDVRVDSGVVRFPFGSLEVKQGFVTLSSDDPFHPQLQVQASSRKFGYDVKMEASGPVTAPIVQFSSNPPLSSEKIVLMLTAGELPKDEFSLTPQQKAQTVAVFVGRDLLNKWGFGDDSEERLTFQSGEELSEKGNPTYNVEYKLTDRWTLVGEYDRFNAFNAGLKWRVYSR